jgi:hypothetical protein
MGCTAVFDGLAATATESGRDNKVKGMELK